MYGLHNSNLRFDPMFVNVLEADEQGQEQPEQGQEQPEQGQENQPPGQGEDEHAVEQLLDLEKMQKHLLFVKVIKFKEQFNAKLKYVKINDNDGLEDIRNILEVVFEFFDQFNVDQIVAILGTLVTYLENFEKTNSSPK